MGYRQIQKHTRKFNLSQKRIRNDEQRGAEPRRRERENEGRKKNEHTSRIEHRSHWTVKRASHQIKKGRWKCGKCLDYSSRKPHTNMILLQSRRIYAKTISRPRKKNTQHNQAKVTKWERERVWDLSQTEHSKNKTVTAVSNGNFAKEKPARHKHTHTVRIGDQHTMNERKKK